MKHGEGVTRRLTPVLGLVFATVAWSATACKDDAADTPKEPGTLAADSASAREGGRVGTAAPRGTDVGDLGPSSGDIDDLIGGDAGGAPAVAAPRDLGPTTSEANWRPEGLRVAYSGPKLPCDGSLILKSSPIDETTAAVHVVDVNDGRVPVDCIAPTTLSTVITDVPRTVATIRFYDPTGAMQTLNVIGAKKR